jgi:glutathionylspermidine synthase
MKRHSNLQKRDNLATKFAELGVHSHDSSDPYWQDDVAYELSPSQVGSLMEATSEVNKIAFKAANHVIDNDLFDRFGIPEEWQDYVAKTWKRQDPFILGRHDFAFDGTGVPKLMEFNFGNIGDLVESSILQSNWAAENGGKKQFNKIEHNLVKVWQRINKDFGIPTPLYFACDYSDPDEMETYEFLMATCHTANIPFEAVDLSNLEFDGKGYIDLTSRKKIQSMYKSFSWEDHWDADIAQPLQNDIMAIMDPAWTAILSNKALLPIMWELEEGHPNLLPTFNEASKFNGGSYVQKPLWGYGGQSITIVDPKDGTSTAGEYGEEGYIYQEYQRISEFDGNTPVCGVWSIYGVPSGLSIREEKSRITTDKCKFAPHFVR